MKIYYDPNKYYEYAFFFSFSREALSFCRSMKEKHGWKDFNFYQGLWRFKNPILIGNILNAFPNASIDDVSILAYETAKIRAEKDLEIANAAERLKTLDSSDIVIPGLKGELYGYQKIGVEFFMNSGGRAILADTMGTGKAQPHGSKVLTPNGWKNIETLMVGDVVLHPSGRRQKVVGFFPQGKKDVYNVIFSDNSRTSCCEDHLWEVYTPDSKFRKAKNRVIPLKEIIKNGLTYKNGNNKWYIPIVSPSLDFESIENNIHPYLLGVLLGDGGLTGNTPRLTSGDAYITDRISKLIKRYGLKLVKSGKYDYSISGKRPLKNKLTVELRKLGLMGKSSLEKGIPNSYLFQSEKRREELLAGLLDTDGHIEKGKNTIEYSSSSKKLATDVLHLINSLGGKGTINKKETKCSPSYRIHISLPNSVVPFRLPRKVKNYKLHTKYYPSRAIVKIEKRKAKEQCVCIKVSQEDGLYITDDFIVTHNTAQTLGYLLAAGHKRTLVVCPASVKYSWEGEVKKWTNLESFVVTSQTDFFDIPPSANVIIINYDVLKKHFKALMAKHWDCCVADECVIPQTYIATKEGQKQVEELSSGEMVLTYNTKSKKYEYKPLLRVIKKPLVRKLKKVGDLICTEDHPIFDGNEYVEARDAKKTFPIGLPELRLGTSDEVLAGCLMGDASLKREKVKEGKANNNGVRLVIGNCIKNEDYIKMKCDVLDILDISRLKIIQNGGYKPGPYFRAASLIDARLISFYEDTYRDGKRLISEKILNMMGEAGLAVWIQDDGSCGSSTIRLNTQRYGLEGNRNLKEWFEKKYNVSPVFCPERKRDGRTFYFLSFCVRDSLKIYSLIRDFIVPSMRYKFVSLEERFNKIYTNICRACGRRIFGLHKARQNIVKNICFCEECKRNGSMKRFKRKKIAEPKKYDYVYDLEVEDNHNFFADGILVHNCQMIKSPTAIRTKAVKTLTRGIKHVIMLSGTPLLSRPIELFNLLNIIDPLVWNDYYDYAKRYCEGTMGFWGFEAKGASNLDELSRRISRYFLRRTKDQVLKELPPKILVPTDIVLEGAYERDYSKASNSFAKFLKENKKKKDPEVLKSLQAERIVKINYLREIAVNGRVDAAREIIDSVVDSGQKVLVFSSFNAPLEELNKIYPDSVMITGKTPVEERGAIVERFQKNPSCKIFLGGYKSAGTGITLTAASVVVTLDYPWNPADIDQAIDRVHRPGVVADSITIYQMSSPNTIDDYIKKLLDKKRNVFNQVVDTQNSKICDINDDDLINLIEEQSRIRKIKN